MASTGLKVTEVNPPHLRDAAIKEKGDLTVQEWESTQNARKNWNSNCQKKTTAIKHCHWSKIGLWPHACVDKHPLELAVTKDDGGIDWAAIDAADWVDPELKSKFQFRINCLYQNYFDAFRFLDIHKKGILNRKKMTPIDLNRSKALMCYNLCLTICRLRLSCCV